MKSKIKLFFLMLFFLSSGVLNAGSLESGLSNTLLRLEQGYNKKNMSLISSCFYTFSEAQQEEYMEIFERFSVINIDIEIEEIIVTSSNTAAVKTTVHKNYQYSQNNQMQSVSFDERVNYVMMRANGPWYIVGAAYPDSGVYPRPITVNDIDEINEALNNLTRRQRREALSMAYPINSTNNTIYWPKSQGAYSYKVYLMKNCDISTDNVVMTSNSLWTTNVIFNYITFGEEVAGLMQKNKIYYLVIVGYDDDLVQTTQQVLYIKRKD